MKDVYPVLSVTGSDCTGVSGIQADLKTIVNMGGYPLTAVTAVTIQDSHGIQAIQPVDTPVLAGQVKAVMTEYHPRVAKVGLVCDASSIFAIRDELVACRHLVLDPGIISSSGRRIISDEALQAFNRYLLPHASLLMLKCKEAELLLGFEINSDDDMLRAADALLRRGAAWVLLRGGNYVHGQVSSLLMGLKYRHFFTSYNAEGWQRHGVGTAFGAAIATRMAMGDDVPQAISKAHEYIHSQVVYAVATDSMSLRPDDLYNEFLSILAGNYRTSHNVQFYADRLCISTRYLSMVTSRVVNKSPHQVISDYLMHEARTLLATSRLSIQEVAYQMGFSSQAMFCRFFKKHEGLTTSAYRMERGVE